MAHDKDKHHRATKKVYKKGSNPLDPHEHYHGDEVHSHPHPRPHEHKHDQGA
jgi:hypothetical protein